MDIVSVASSSVSNANALINAVPYLGLFFKIIFGLIGASIVLKIFLSLLFHKK